uniref:Heterogeneous nuclear ribonucleoprotein M n=1 Tax=Seriola dumerili TaxID=41447 RepID=A0A3B4T9W3_SERDU
METAKHESNSSRKERPQKRGGGGRYEPYGNANKRYRVFVSNIPYDVKWQALKDLMKEKGKVSLDGLVNKNFVLTGYMFVSVVEFRTEELMKKAVEKVNKHNLNGRPLKVKEVGMGGMGGMGGMDRMNMDRMGPGPNGPINIPPSLMNNPNIPNEIIHGLQAGRIGSTVFVANLDYKVGWKKLKEVFSMAGMVVRADILEDKDGKSRGMGTVTFDMPIEAVQAVCILLKNVGMDRMGMDRMDRVSDLDRLGSGFDRMGSGMDRLGPSMDRLGPGLDRMSSSMDRLGPAGFDRLGPSGLDRMSSGLDFGSPMNMDRMGNTGLDRMASSFDRMGSTGGLDRFPSGGLDRMSSGMDRMGSGGVGGQFDRSADLDRGFGGNSFGGAGAGGPGTGGGNVRKGCQIFVRNLPFDFTWKMLKDTFNTCGMVQYADIKMENGKSKGCGVVRFDNPETAERACRTMNGYRLNGREIDVRIDRNA